MRRFGFWRDALAAVVAAAMLGTGVTTAAAQTTGQIQGEVLEAGSGRPLAGAQVFIPGTNRGTLTNENGQFLLLNAPAGQVTFRVSMIGFGTADQVVDVTADGTATANFALEPRAVALDEVVVTGQGAESRRREIGTAIATVNTQELQTAPVGSFSELLQGRAPGVNVLTSGGKVGQGTKIVLRGPTTVSQGIQPVIYVDGVRMDNSSATGVFTGGTTWSGLDDINPADIERVEIVKGAAAATLYGTEASSGVIQIFTKRGQQGATRWNYRGEAGFARTPADWWDVSVYSPWFYDNYIGSGFQQEHQLSASGGVEGFSYYASGTYRDQAGVLPNNGEDYYAFRGNMQLFPREDLVLRLNTGYSHRVVEMPQDANNIYGYAINALTTGARGNFVPPAQIGLIEVFLGADRFTGGLTAEYTPRENLTHRFTVGADVVTMDNTEFHPYGANDSNPQGRKSNYRRNSTSLTLEYIGTWDLQLTDGISSRLMGGLQAYQQDIGSNEASGSDFPVPGLSTVGAVANSTGTESRLLVKEAGFMLQERLGFRDRLFLTFGARADAHSAFGEDYPYQVYPKVSASYVLSDHNFWPESWGSMRLRAAYGTAGRQPGAFDSVRMWDATSAFEGEPAVTPDNLGNPELAPEVSHEFEAGVDAGLLEGRLGVNLTYYNQRTRDALLEVLYPPSAGFLDEQLENVGEISNQGFEVAVNATLIDRPGFFWSASANVATNENEVVDLGSQPELAVQWTQFNREGYPVGAFFGDYYKEVDGEVVAVTDQPFLLDEDGNVRVDENGVPLTNPDNPGYIGPAFPTRTLQFSSSVTLWDRLHLRALLDHAGGHFVESSTVRWLTQLTVPNDDPVLPESMWGKSVASYCLSPSDPALAAFCDDPWPSGGRGNTVMPADYWKLREVTVSYDIPGSLLGPLGFSNAVVYVSGRNLWRHQETLAMEAEANYDTQDDLAAQDYFVTPIPQQFVAGVRIGFGGGSSQSASR